MPDLTVLSIVVASLVAGVLLGFVHLFWWPAPKGQRGMGLAWHMLAVVVLAMAGASDVFSLGPALCWLLAPTLGVLTWQLGRYESKRNLYDAIPVVVSVFPGGIFLSIALSLGGSRDPVAWTARVDDFPMMVWVVGHYFGALLPILLAVWEVVQDPTGTRLRGVVRVVVGLLMGAGALGVGVSLLDHPIPARLVAALMVPLLVSGLAWSVRGPDAWRPRADPATRAALAVSMARVLQGTTNRLGSELALAASHARALSDEAPSRLAGPMNELLVVLQRGQDMAGSLGRFSETRIPSRAMVDVGAAAERSIARVQRETGGVFKIVLRPPEARVWTDALSLERSLRALLRNAAEAQEVRGSDAAIEVRLQTDIPAVRSTGLVAGALTNQQYLVVQIDDNGDGMTPHVRERCLEPFFTTRDKQDGLGLLDPLGMVRSEGAALEFLTLARGTRVRLWIPRGSRAAAAVGGQWEWSLVGTEDARRDVILVGSDTLQMELYGLFFDARGVSWGALSDIANLTAGQLAPRTDGVLLLLDIPSEDEIADLARWLLPRFVRVVGLPATVSALVNRGFGPEQVLAYDERSTRTVVSTVIDALSPTHTDS